MRLPSGARTTSRSTTPNTRYVRQLLPHNRQSMWFPRTCFGCLVESLSHDCV
jgi:hypothetical protein